MDLADVPPRLIDSTDLADRRRVVTDHFARRGRLLVGLAMRLGMGAEEATDVVQEAHLRLWRELCAGASIDNPDAWMTRVVYHLAMSEHRVRRRLRAVVQRIPTPLGHGADPAAALEGMALWEAVDRLPPRQRATLYLRYQGDLPFEAIGDAIGVTAGAARTYASRGLARLRANGEERLDD